MSHIEFPYTRLRRTRMQDWSRRMVAENRVTVDDLIWPIFVIDGDNKTESVESLPGVERMSIDKVVQAAKQAQDLGIPALHLFSATDQRLKTIDGAEVKNPDNLICNAARAIKAVCPDIGIICDVALDQYTDHGHDGVFRDDEIHNDETVEIMTLAALNHAAAGCDVIAPSDMMDGRNGVIREALEKAGYQNTLIMAYAAKYASKFYGPFRDALQSQGNLTNKDKKSYQMDPANSDEALREIAMDISEGADMVMVKPGMPYLDVLHRVKTTFKVPTYAYQVSGEYAMIKAASANGWLEEEAIIMESLLCFKRAGADGILTYFAPVVAEWLQK